MADFLPQKMTLNVQNWHFSSADFQVLVRDLRVIFHRWPKLHTGFDVEREIQILKGL